MQCDALISGPQFSLNDDYYLKTIDLQNWYRYYFLIKEMVKIKPKNILEIGAGNKVVKNCLQEIVESYKVMDINSKLKPDILSDLREFKPELEGKFDCIVCADVLEHMPFADLEKNLVNIYKYLNENGKAFITIPHRRTHFMFITPLSSQKPILITIPTGFCSPGSFYRRFIRRKIWIDPHHCWEIGDGKIKKRDIEADIKKSQLKVDKFAKLLYVDSWILKKSYE